MKEKAANRFAVRPVAFRSSRGMATIRATSELWLLSMEDLENLPINEVCTDNSFVRIFPPASATAEAVRVVVEVCVAHGCTVRVMPRPNVRATLPAAAPDRPMPSLRATVEEVLATARTRDPEALAAACRRAMDEEGL